VIPAQSHDVPARNSDQFKAGPKETPLLDDSPLMEGWQIALTAGRGRLIIFPEAQVVADGHTLGLVTKIDPALLEGPQKRTLKMDDSYRISSSARAADPLVQALRHSTAPPAVRRRPAPVGERSSVTVDAYGADPTGQKDSIAAVPFPVPVAVTLQPLTRSCPPASTTIPNAADPRIPSTVSLLSFSSHAKHEFPVVEVTTPGPTCKRVPPQCGLTLSAACRTSTVSIEWHKGCVLAETHG